MICKVAVLVAPSSLTSVVPDAAPPSVSSPPVAVLTGLLEALARVPDPRNPRGVRYRLSTLLAVGVCAMPSAGHNSLTAIADRPPRRRAFAVDGKCLRGAVRADGSRVFVMTAVRHDDTLTAALPEIGAKTNEIPEFAPLLDQIDQAGLTDAVITVDALHAQKDHARYLVEQRDAHYLLSVKNNQPTLAGQLRTLPWREVPVLDRSRTRGRGREEVREVKVVTVDGLLFPHARQVVRIHRKRRRIGARKWQTETVYAVTDLAAHQADATEIAAWARGH